MRFPQAGTILTQILPLKHRGNMQRGCSTIHRTCRGQCKQPWLSSTALEGHTATFPPPILLSTGFGAEQILHSPCNTVSCSPTALLRLHIDSQNQAGEKTNGSKTELKVSAIKAFDTSFCLFLSK